MACLQSQFTPQNRQKRTTRKKSSCSNGKPLKKYRQHRAKDPCSKGGNEDFPVGLPMEIVKAESKAEHAADDTDEKPEQFSPHEKYENPEKNFCRDHHRPPL